MPPSLDDTLIFVAQKHRGQVDKAGQPYILHVLRVMLRMPTESHRIVALLHDVVEDCGVTLDELRRMGYPDGEVRAVYYLTKRPEEAENYGAYIARIAAGPSLARVVKIEDLRDNANLSRLANPTDADRRRQAKYIAAFLLLEDVEKRER